MQFLTTLLIAGAAVAAPTPSTTCTSDSARGRAWTVEKFDYHASYLFTTPAHQVSSGFVNFTLSNPALDFKPVCSATSTQLEEFFYGNMNYTCINPTGGQGVANFTYSVPSGQLNINQTWDCVGEDSRFWAQGSAQLNLTCETESYQNPDWKMGETYSSKTVTCNKVNAKVPITALQGIA